MHTSNPTQNTLNFSTIIVTAFLLLMSITPIIAQSDARIYEIIDAVSEDRLRADVKKLADFGTRHTLSDTVSQTRGIGAARRWIKKEFEKTAAIVILL